ncbi:flagellar basal body-associated protein FliL [Sodalis glossinidius str. 'morsitans']|uniref:Flagellar protein FliL n=1 Tax=Sodalis glossinidius (strain morsitans) TaxID=343509 RepID=Q2NR98_SODGM|nr:flagellar basal body-associated protein FliL [Sodalis glossinidius]BAE75327.1 flagellar protein FliL [Sodalis glossinidius str. 'morsitans']CRL46344.1 flagellar basal body-associated protein FliL [Sodalis glossinidius str. 'morsitans']
MSESARPIARTSAPWITPLVIVLIAASGAAGYFWWQLRAAATTSLAPPPAPVFMVLETFTVNVANPDNDLDRVLYVGLTLRLPNEETRKTFNDYLPLVHSRLLLSRQQAGELASPQGKQGLIDKIKQTLAEPLVAGQPPQVVDDVLFTAFILR